MLLLKPLLLLPLPLWCFGGLTPHIPSFWLGELSG
uniref:Uncharacterized protein n=1 Tax=Rhizophora mucronata TaxID=61149 RepID=A0A2P2PVF7_RHIMU